MNFFSCPAKRQSYPRWRTPHSNVAGGAGVFDRVKDVCIRSHKKSTTSLEMLLTWLLPRLQAGEDYDYSFQAPPHWSLNVREFLNTNHWLCWTISQCGLQMASKITRPDCLRLFPLGICQRQSLRTSPAPDHG